MGSEKFTSRIGVLQKGKHAVKAITNSFKELASLQISRSSCQWNINTF